MVQMIDQARIDECRRMLAEGELPQRAIARRLGISRGTVGAVKTGKRPDDPARRRRAETRPEGPIEKCPGCGGKVAMPCHACRVRGLLKQCRRLPWPEPEPDDPLRMELRPGDYERYRAVHAKKVAAAEAACEAAAEDDWDEAQTPTDEELAALERELQTSH